MIVDVNERNLNDDLTLISPAAIAADTTGVVNTPKIIKNIFGTTSPTNKEIIIGETILAVVIIGSMIIFKKKK